MTSKYAWMMQMAMLLPPNDAVRLEVEREVMARLGASASEDAVGPANEWAPRAKRVARPKA